MILITRKKLWTMIAICLPITAALAEHETIDDKPKTLLFRSGEFSLDVFGTASLDQDTLDDISGDAVENNTEFGVGVGINYFFARFLGFGIDAYSENTTGPFVDNASANVILRIPLDSIHLAPYVYGGGGYQFDPGEVWFAQVGAGLEVRFCANVAVFGDARYVMTDQIENFGMARFGLRLAF